MPLLGPGLFTRNSFVGSWWTVQSGGGGLGTKTVDQEEGDAALPVFFFSRLWLYVVGLLLSLSAGRRISDVKVGNGIGVDDDCNSISSLSSQRSIISEDNELAWLDDALAFAGAVEGVLVVGLVKKEESFDCPALSFFGFDPPAAVDVPVRERLRDSWDDSCDSLREEV